MVKLRIAKGSDFKLNIHFLNSFEKTVQNRRDFIAIKHNIHNITFSDLKNRS